MFNYVFNSEFKPITGKSTQIDPLNPSETDPSFHFKLPPSTRFNKRIIESRKCVYLIDKLF